MASSKTASVYSIVVHASSAIAAIAALTALVHPDGDRHRGATGQGGVDRRRGRRTPSPSAPGPAGSCRAVVGVVFTASPTSRFAPRGDPAAPLRSRWATITGAARRGRAAWPAARSGHGPRCSRTRRPAWRGRGPRRWCRRHRATRTRAPCPALGVPRQDRSPAPSSRVSPASAIRNREATASSWRTWPKVNARRNDPNVEGA